MTSLAEGKPRLATSAGATTRHLGASARSGANTAFPDSHADLGERGPHAGRTAFGQVGKALGQRSGEAVNLAADGRKAAQRLWRAEMASDLRTLQACTGSPFAEAPRSKV